MDLPLIIADRRHALFGHMCRLLPEAPAALCQHVKR